MGTVKNDAVGVAGTPLAVLSNLWRRRSGNITLSASEGPTKVCWRLREIEEAFNLAQLDLEIGLTILNSPGPRGVILNPGRLFQLLESAMWNLTFLDVTASDIEVVGSIRVQLQQHDHRLVDVRRLARQLQDLDAVPLGSPLRFLAISRY